MYSDDPLQVPTTHEPEDPALSADRPRPPARRRNPLAQGLRELVKTGLLALIVFVGARMVVLPYQVDGRSMDPSLHDQERVLVNRAVYMRVDLDRLVGWVPGVDIGPGDVAYPFHAPERGDVVVLNPPQGSEEPYIKRVVAVAGETIEFRDGGVFVDGMRLDEPYVGGAETECRGEEYCGGYTVPEGHVFVLGDNRDASLDSRAFGPVALDHIIGEAWFINWPLSEAGRIPG